MTDTTGRPRRGPRGEYAKTGAKREAILDAALRVFAESGYRAGSLREISARVGMSEAGLLHHFPNKEALLAAVLDRRDGDDLARARVAFDSEDGADTLHVLVELADHNASVPGVVELYCTLSAEATSPDHPAHEYFVGRYDWVRDVVGRAFERIAREGRLREGVEPARAAVATLALMDGLQVQWLLNRDIVDMSDALREYFASLVADF